MVSAYEVPVLLTVSCFHPKTTTSLHQLCWYKKLWDRYYSDWNYLDKKIKLLFLTPSFSQDGLKDGSVRTLVGQQMVEQSLEFLRNLKLSWGSHCTVQVPSGASIVGSSPSACVPIMRMQDFHGMFQSTKISASHKRSLPATTQRPASPQAHSETGHLSSCSDIHTEGKCLADPSTSMPQEEGRYGTHLD